MSAPQRMTPAATSRRPNQRAALIAAYREGLRLAAVVLIRDGTGLRIAAEAPGTDSGCQARAPEGGARWWCRRSADAERVAAAATRRLARRRAQDEALATASGPSSSPHDNATALTLAAAAIADAARRLNVALASDDDVAREADLIIARVDEEMARLQRAGDLKSVNRAYRSYRLETSARGEKSLPYAQWLNKYRQNLVRQLADALRSL